MAEGTEARTSNIEKSDIATGEEILEIAWHKSTLANVRYAVFRVQYGWGVMRVTVIDEKEIINHLSKGKFSSSDEFALFLAQDSALLALYLATAEGEAPLFNPPAFTQPHCQAHQDCD